MYPNEYKIPNRKKWLLTEDFLMTLKQEIDIAFNDKQEDKNYWNYYAHLEETKGYYNALEKASIKFNVVKAIYEYTRKLEWYKSDQFTEYVFNRMIDLGVIEEGNAVDFYGDYDKSLETMAKQGDIRWTEEIKQYDGYSVKTKNWEFTENNL